MEDVTILNTIYEYGRLISPIWFLIFAIAALIIAFIGMCTVNYDTIQRILHILIAIAIIGIAICGIGASIKTNKIVDTKYQVIVSDDVNFNEFHEKYEIIEQNGKIYTVREK